MRDGRLYHSIDHVRVGQSGKVAGMVAEHEFFQLLQTAKDGRVGIRKRHGRAVEPNGNITRRRDATACVPVDPAGIRYRVLRDCGGTIRKARLAGAVVTRVCHFQCCGMLRMEAAKIPPANRTFVNRPESS